MKIRQKKRGITLISLVVTIVLLLIFAGTSAVMLTKENGILSNAKKAKEETIKQTAIEKLNLKITNSQIKSYTKEQRIPTLQEVANDLCEDNEMEYVTLESKKNASLDKVIVGEKRSIFTKFKEYPYEFEINSSLQLASIDGITIATNSNESTITLTQSQYNSILNRLTAVENKTNSTIGRNNYSTIEQVVGTWVDGKNIYRIVIDLGTNFKSGSIDVSSYNIETLINYDLLGSDQENYTANLWTMSNVSGCGNPQRQAFLTEKTKFTINSSYYERWAILEYTKSTDTVKTNN